MIIRSQKWLIDEIFEISFFRPGKNYLWKNKGISLFRMLLFWWSRPIYSGSEFQLRNRLSVTCITWHAVLPKCEKVRTASKVPPDYTPHTSLSSIQLIITNNVRKNNFLNKERKIINSYRRIIVNPWLSGLEKLG